MKLKHIASIVLIALLPFAVKAATSNCVINGDLNHDGRLTNDDIVALRDICLNKSKLQQGRIVNGSLVFSEVSSYSPASDGSSFLNGDVDHDNKITVGDIIKLLTFIKAPALTEYVGIVNGKIISGKMNGFVFVPEDNGFIDDGEEEL